MFPRHVASLRGDKAWSAGSPDLNICDFFWWNYLKEKLFTHCSHHLPHLKDVIVEEMNTIPYILIVHLFKTLENVFKGVLMLTANLGALFLKHDELKMAFTDQFRYKVKICPCILSFIYYSSSKMFCRSATPCMKLQLWGKAI